MYVYIHVYIIYIYIYIERGRERESCLFLKSILDLIIWDSDQLSILISMTDFSYNRFRYLVLLFVKNGPVYIFIYIFHL